MPWTCISKTGGVTRLALIYDSPVTDTIKKYTYRQLRDEVAKFAGVLKAQGVTKGDRVLIYMPMIAEAAIAMLACARIGAVHSVVFGGFAAKELATRINDAKPKVIVSASCGIEVKKVIAYKPLLDKAIDMSTSKPEKCIIFQRPMEKASMIAGRDVDWVDAMAAAARQTACRWRPRIRCTSFTPRAPRVSPRAWYGTTAATWWP